MSTTIVTACRSCAIPIEIKREEPLSPYHQVETLFLLSETVTCSDCGRVHHPGTFMRFKRYSQEEQSTQSTST